MTEDEALYTAPMNGWWTSPTYPGQTSVGGLIVSGHQLTPGETIIYQKMLEIEKLLAALAQLSEPR